MGDIQYHLSLTNLKYIKNMLYEALKVLLSFVLHLRNSLNIPCVRLISPATFIGEPQRDISENLKTIL